MKELVYNFRAGSPSIGTGPVWFGGRNDHSAGASISYSSVYLYLSSVTVASTFILVVLTARRRRASTMLLGALTGVSAFAVANGILEPFWYEGEAELISSYCMYNPNMMIRARLGVYIGLDHFNVTYQAHNDSGIDYNNVFPFVYGGRHLPEAEHKKRAFSLGLPNAVITTAEYMETSGGGFAWTRFSSAGYNLYTVTATYTGELGTGHFLRYKRKSALTGDFYFKIRFWGFKKSLL